MTDQQLATLLLDARGGSAIPAGPATADQVPEDQAQAYRVQALVMAELGAIGGWKVGAAGPDAPVSCAPMPAALVFEAPHRLDQAVFTRREVESEICFRLARDLPARPVPYTRDDVVAAIGSCHPGIEVLQSRYADPDAAGALAVLADFIQSGAYVVGAPIGGWDRVDFAGMRVVQTIGGAPPKQAVGNPAGDMIRLVVWLANTGAVWAGGLRAGQVVTCGSWTGKTEAAAGAEVTVAFEGAVPVVLRFG